jgi:hypothetical protein
MNIYYEHNNNYTAQYNMDPWDDAFYIRYSSRLMYSASRIWLEDETGVRYIKHRHAPEHTPVDLEEFIVVKLKSIPL